MVSYTPLTKETKKGMARTNCWKLESQADENWKKNCFVTIIVQKILTRIGESLAFHIFKSGLNVLEIVSITGLGKEVTQ